MSGLEAILWWMLLVVGLAGSALYSGLETGTYRLNRVRLHVFEQQRVTAAIRLARLVARPGTLLTTLLIGNNITNYLGTASLTVILASRGLGDWQIIATNVLILTPILFVFGETIPKDLFAAHSDKLMYRFSGPLLLSQRLFTVMGLLPVIEWLTRLAMRITGTHQGLATIHPRRKVEVLVQEGVGYGLLSPEQSAIVERVLDLSGRQVRDEMVPWSRVMTLSVQDGPDRLRALADSTPRSRFPVLDAAGELVGVVNVTDALLHRRDQCPPIEQLMTRPVTLDADTPLRTALSQLQTGHQPLAVVTDRDRPVGIVTVKDLVEPITGELANW
ncbi:MAG: CNNM domain-containing protein [Phycisphaeraceae bacterium]